ncbi:RxLR effector protein [Phytophthora megakarya]|uniref:RxLR effector protein n=1 Tax=Phytophthora megakarya TaxID=4795 RepID=A0A225WYJ3_9STRA|nr:RxLR effector protein [Phytophthora megakarya]
MRVLFFVLLAAASASTATSQPKLVSQGLSQSTHSTPVNSDSTRFLRGRNPNDDSALDDEERGVKELGNTIKSLVGKSQKLERTKSGRTAEEVAVSVEKAKEMLKDGRLSVDMYTNNIHPNDVYKALNLEPKVKLAYKQKDLSGSLKLHQDADFMKWRAYKNFYWHYRGIKQSGRASIWDTTS